MNIQTDEQKDENYIPLGINAGGITSSSTNNLFKFWKENSRDVNVAPALGK